MDSTTEKDVVKAIFSIEDALTALHEVSVAILDELKTMNGELRKLALKSTVGG